MSQNDFTIANQGFPAFRADLNSALQALASNNSGTSAPSTTFANMWWYDSSNNIMYIRNEDNDAWIQFAVLDQTTDTFKFNGLEVDGNLTIDGGTIKLDGNYPVGTSNVALGNNAGNSIVSGGNYNTVIGDEAGTGITTGDENSFFGNNAGYSLNTGTLNVAMGRNALYSDTKGNKSTAVGKGSLGSQNFTSSTDTHNTAVGYEAGKSVSSGIQNTLIGGLAGDALSDADSNVVVGYNALTSDTKGNRSVAIGRSALAVQNFTSSTMVYNTAVGYNAGGAVTTGKQSTFLGGLSGDAVSDGTGNTALGYGALSTEQRGNKSTAVGWQALLVANRGSSADSFNTALGYNAGSSVNTGIKNTFIGGGAGSAITSGSNNTILGTFGGNGGGLDIRTSSNNIVLSDGDGNPRGKHNGTTWRWSANAYTTALEYDGNQIYPLADNTTKLGYPDNRWTVVYATTGSINTSDQELKQDIESLSDAELRVATRIKGLIKKFRWKDAVATKGDDARIHVGAIAQEVEQAFTDESLDADRYAIFCKDEWYEVDGKRAESLLEPYTSETENAVKVTRLGLRYDQLLAFVIATL